MEEWLKQLLMVLIGTPLSIALIIKVQINLEKI